MLRELQVTMSSTGSLHVPASANAVKPLFENLKTSVGAGRIRE